MLRSHHFSAVLTASQRTLGYHEADILALLKSAVYRAELTPVGELAFTFAPQGISAVVLLEESHVAVHVWHEIGKVTLDIHVCDYHQDNQRKAERLAQILTTEISDKDDLTDWRCLLVTG